jgi:hypothetical protein
MISLKNKSWVLKKRLPQVVDVMPSEITGDEKSIIFHKIDKHKIIIDTSRPRFFPLIYLLVCGLGAKGFYNEANGEIIGLCISTIFAILSLIALCWFIFHRKKYVIFDRDKGTVSIPGPFWYKNVEVQFEDVVAVIRTETYYYAHLKVLNLYRPDGYKADVGINSYSLDALRNDWAFYVWYMDKSRPLPPAPVFDAYRGSSEREPLLGEAVKE